MIQVSKDTWEFDSLPLSRFLELNVTVHATADGQMHSIFGSCVTAWHERNTRKKPVRKGECWGARHVD